MPRFQPGNPGKPVGSGNQNRRLKKLLAPYIFQLAEQRLAAALQGDTQAADAVLGLWGHVGSLPATP